MIKDFNVEVKSFSDAFQVMYSTTMYFMALFSLSLVDYSSPLPLSYFTDFSLEVEGGTGWSNELTGQPHCTPNALPSWGSALALFSLPCYSSLGFFSSITFSQRSSLTTQWQFSQACNTSRPTPDSRRTGAWSTWFSECIPVPWAERIHI